MTDSNSTSTYAIAVDIGGTFTDVTLADLATGRLWQTKVPTTPDDQSRAFAEGIRRVLSKAGLTADAVGGVFHGTTVATNAILERKGARVGLLTTRGCRYVTHIARQNVPKDAHPYTWIRPARLVQPRLIFEVEERLGPTGVVEQALDKAQCRAAIRAARDAGVESLAICFLHAYASPVHERRARELVAEEAPGLPASISSDVLPVYREYERTTATTLNAYVLPRVARYHERLEARLTGMGVAAPLRIMKSNGGMYSAADAAAQPIHAILSGPAAAVVGGIVIGKTVEQPNVISIDVGGTSADICLSRGGEPEISIESEIAGLPLSVPMVDVHTIGAGGGSIARVVTGGRLLVGPESAGAEPGPVCYGLGGQEPTVTDANLVLGRVPVALADGQVRLDLELARRAIQERVAAPLGLSLEAAADGVVEILNNTMAAAVRAVSIERGYDPRAFALVAGGGAGPLHGGRLAELLGIPTVIVPASAGLLSTIGLLATDLKADYAQTTIQRAGAFDLERIAAVFAKLEAAAAAWLEREGVPAERRAIAYGADMRYANQGYDIPVPLPGSGGKRLSLETLLRCFQQEHQRLYNWSSPALPVELVNLRVTAYGTLGKLTPRRLDRARAAAAIEPLGRRRVFCGRQHGAVETPVFRYDDLAPGWTALGPAIVEQHFSTVLVLPGHRVILDAYGNLVMETPR